MSTERRPTNSWRSILIAFNKNFQCTESVSIVMFTCRIAADNIAFTLTKRAKQVSNVRAYYYVYVVKHPSNAKLYPYDENLLLLDRNWKHRAWCRLSSTENVNSLFWSITLVRSVGECSTMYGLRLGTKVLNPEDVEYTISGMVNFDENVVPTMAPREEEDNNPRQQIWMSFTTQGLGKKAADDNCN